MHFDRLLGRRRVPHKYVELPNRLEVLYGTTKKRCRVVWKRGLRFGVAF